MMEKKRSGKGTGIAYKGILLVIGGWFVYNGILVSHEYGVASVVVMVMTICAGITCFVSACL